MLGTPKQMNDQWEAEEARAENEIKRFEVAMECLERDLEFCAGNAGLSVVDSIRDMDSDDFYMAIAEILSAKRLRGDTKAAVDELFRLVDDQVSDELAGEL